jgi:hypothetical protein
VNGQSVVEAMAEMRQVLDINHPLVQSALEGIADDLRLTGHDLDDLSDEDIWDLGCGSGIDLSTVFIQIRRFYSVVFALQGLDKQWHIRQACCRTLCVVSVYGVLPNCNGCDSGGPATRDASNLDK